MADDLSSERQHLRQARAFSLRYEFPSSTARFFLGIGRHRFSLYDDGGAAFHYDLEGRLRRAYVDGVKFVRGIDGRVVRKAPSSSTNDRFHSHSPNRDTSLPFEAEQAIELFALARQTAVEALESLEGEAAREDVRRLLRAATRFTSERRLREREDFLAAYEPVGVLPPDCYASLILQATSGCRYARCAFCTIYRGVPYRPKTIDEFREHVIRVRRFFGASISSRKGVFLGEANALELPTSDLETMMRIARDELPEVVGHETERLAGFAAFTDAFEGRRKSADDLAKLVRLGLRRVHVGVESGDEVTLRALRKPATCTSVLRRVRDLKAAGVAVRAILLAGAGGRQRTREHVSRSLELVERMQLDERDLVYVSRLESSPTAGFLDLFGEPSPETVVREEGALRHGLKGLGVRSSRYDLRGFVYA